MIISTVESLFKDESDKVVFSLVKEIKEDNLAPGDKISSIRTYSEKLGLTQSKIRSGLMKAEAIGLIKIVPRSGCFVSEIDISNMIDIFVLLFEAMYMNEQSPLFELYELKTSLERGISKRVARIRTIEDLAELKQILDSMDETNELSEMVRLDELFHNKLATSSRNTLFISLIKVIHAMLRESRLNYDDYVSEFPQSRDEHHKLFEAIKEQNEEFAGELAEKHSNRRKEILSKRVID